MGKRRDKDENTRRKSVSITDTLSERCVSTRDAVALRVTIMMGHTGRYLETKRADSPLHQSQHSLYHSIT